MGSRNQLNKLINEFKNFERLRYAWPPRSGISKYFNNRMSFVLIKQSSNCLNKCAIYKNS